MLIKFWVLKRTTKRKQHRQSYKYVYSIIVFYVFQISYVSHVWSTLQWKLAQKNVSISFNINFIHQIIKETFWIIKYQPSICKQQDYKNLINVTTLLINMCMCKFYDFNEDMKLNLWKYETFNDFFIYIYCNCTNIH